MNLNLVTSFPGRGPCTITLSLATIQSQTLTASYTETRNATQLDTSLMLITAPYNLSEHDTT